MDNDEILKVCSEDRCEKFDRCRYQIDSFEDAFETMRCGYEKEVRDEIYKVFMGDHDYTLSEMLILNRLASSLIRTLRLEDSVSSNSEMIFGGESEDRVHPVIPLLMRMDKTTLQLYNSLDMERRQRKDREALAEGMTKDISLLMSEP